MNESTNMRDISIASYPCAQLVVKTHDKLLPEQRLAVGHAQLKREKEPLEANLQPSNNTYRGYKQSGKRRNDSGALLGGGTDTRARQQAR